MLFFKKKDIRLPNRQTISHFLKGCLCFDLKDPGREYFYIIIANRFKFFQK